MTTAEIDWTLQSTLLNYYGDNLVIEDWDEDGQFTDVDFIAELLYHKEIILGVFPETCTEVRDHWQQSLEALYGDVDSNGIINAADVTAVDNHHGATDPYLVTQHDADLDGDVDQDDSDWVLKQLGMFVNRWEEGDASDICSVDCVFDDTWPSGPTFEPSWTPPVTYNGCGACTMTCGGGRFLVEKEPGAADCAFKMMLVPESCNCPAAPSCDVETAPSDALYIQKNGESPKYALKIVSCASARVTIKADGTVGVEICAGKGCKLGARYKTRFTITGPFGVQIPVLGPPYVGGWVNPAEDWDCDSSCPPTGTSCAAAGMAGCRNAKQGGAMPAPVCLLCW